MIFNDGKYKLYTLCAILIILSLWETSIGAAVVKHVLLKHKNITKSKPIVVKHHHTAYHATIKKSKHKKNVYIKHKALQTVHTLVIDSKEQEPSQNILHNAYDIYDCGLRELNLHNYSLSCQKLEQAKELFLKCGKQGLAINHSLNLDLSYCAERACNLKLAKSALLDSYQQDEEYPAEVYVKLAKFSKNLGELKETYFYLRQGIKKYPDNQTLKSLLEETDKIHDASK